MQGNKKGVTNAAFVLISEKFNFACERVGLKATKRQAGKYRNKKGLAYKGGENIVRKETDI